MDMIDIATAETSDRNQLKHLVKRAAELLSYRYSKARGWPDEWDKQRDQWLQDAKPK